ncbi:MAG: MCE family protein [Verrucomicrobia bacterium]|nr:MAG: MCE family protein [Verrucomicrobiota bacterium]
MPLLALVIGGWMIFRHFTSQGPTARIGFETADGIFAGKTEVRCRSVRVGVVKDVKLTQDLKSVVIYIELEPESENLLRKNTRFWVVRPRVSASDISGLNTILTGNYIELEPGNTNEPAIHDFRGLETPPTTNSNVPGLRIKLIADEAGSLLAGSPIYFRGFEVGRFESRTLASDGQHVIYDAFIEEEYSGLLKSNTRFWNSSGVDVSAGADGFRLRTPSLQAMVAGGATFGAPDDESPSNPVSDGATFSLYSSEDDAVSAKLNPTLRLLMLFDQSVRGLNEGDMVEFRGIKIGRVSKISLNYLQDPADNRIPVEIFIDPFLMQSERDGKNQKDPLEIMQKFARDGLRASLKTGNLLTGAMFVDFDFYPEKFNPGLVLTKISDVIVMPTASSGFAQLEAKLTAILDKIEALPLAETMGKIDIVAAQAATSLKEIEATAAAARQTLTDPNFRELPDSLRKALAQVNQSVASIGPDGAIQGDLLRTLDELRATLRSLSRLSNTLDEKPNSLIFGNDAEENPVPKAPRFKP